MSSRIYTQVVTVGSVSIYEVVASPNGVLQAAKGSLALRSDTSETWQNLDGAMSWGRTPFDVIQQRVQLADLPNAITTGTVSFGAVIEAHRVVLGGILYLNAAVNVGLSGITSVQATLGGGGANQFTTLELVGEPAPKYLTGFDDDTSFTKGFVASLLASQPGYAITADAATLDALVAFDVTFLLFVSPVILSVP